MEARAIIDGYMGGTTSNYRTDKSALKKILDNGTEYPKLDIENILRKMLTQKYSVMVMMIWN